MLAKGYQVKNITDHMAVYRKMSSAGMAMLLGSRYDPIPEDRVSCTILESDGGVRIVATVAVVTNPGSAFERIWDLSMGKQGHAFQAELEQFKALFAKKQ